ncbi:hypothetical protein L596_011282 [Steinernema carpocapsae]|uniref:ZP domain-containing protein n=1 Tax=Steinernema carpocapsae TaxID=34508 RepID=A0A4U5NTE3_STECR|nr:hypothetical protein L596_011282 [Steinernema carpocapsae]
MEVLFWVVFACLGSHVSAAVCPLGAVAAFFKSKKAASNGLDKCVSICGQEHCSGIYMSTNGCLTMNLEDFFGSMDERRFIRKFCLKGKSPGVFVDTGMAGNLMGTVGEAKDIYECASLCLQSTICEYMAFDGKNCFYDADSKDNKTSLPPNIVIHLRENVRYDAMCESHDRSFALRPIQRTTVYGTENELEGGYSRDKCLEECSKQKCVYTVYQATKSKCSVFLSSEDPKDIFKVKTSDYSIFENLCKSQIVNADECPRENSIFVKEFVDLAKNVPHCLDRCITDPTCQETKTGGSCAFGKPIRKLCLSDAIDSDVGTFFEKSAVACPKAKKSNKIDRITLDQCLEVCVTHPTQSCGGVNYHKANGTCELIDIDSGPQEGQENEDCDHYIHNIFEFEGEPEETQDAMWPFEKTLEGEKVNSNHIRRKPFHETKTTSAQNLKSEISLKPICDYGSIKVVVNASGPHNVDVFPKDQSERCLKKFTANTVGELDFESGNDTFRCHFKEVRKDVFSQLIVVKRNQVEGLPVITLNDLIINVTCDYSKITEKTVVTEIIHLRTNQSTNNIKIRGRVDLSRAAISIALRSKRAQAVERAVLGQQIELVFQAHLDGNTTDYSIPLCYATNDRGTENLTMIEDGCPSLSVQKSLMIGEFKKSPKSFVLPFRAFKFANNSEVRIVCVVEPCSKICDKSCDLPVRKIHRNRRYLLEEGVDRKRVELSFTVDEFGDELGEYDSLRMGQFCIHKLKLVAVTSSISLVLVVQAVVLFFFIFSNQKRRKGES